jgi:hypothetical protein
MFIKMLENQIKMKDSITTERTSKLEKDLQELKQDSQEYKETCDEKLRSMEMEKAEAMAKEKVL